MSTSQISKHLPYDISEYQKKDKVRRKEAINFTKQLIMEDDNDDYENECDESIFFTYLPHAKHYARIHLN